VAQATIQIYVHETIYVNAQIEEAFYTGKSCGYVVIGSSSKQLLGSQKRKEKKKKKNKKNHTCFISILK
jgi:hypothetical protein